MYRDMLNVRKRKRNESLSELAQDIATLVARAFPGPKTHHLDLIAVDAFLRALDDADLVEKARGRDPDNLDMAFKIALRYESYRTVGNSFLWK